MKLVALPKAKRNHIRAERTVDNPCKAIINLRPKKTSINTRKICRLGNLDFNNAL